MFLFFFKKKKRSGSLQDIFIPIKMIMNWLAVLVAAVVVGVAVCHILKSLAPDRTKAELGRAAHCAAYPAVRFFFFFYVWVRTMMVTNPRSPLEP